MTLEELGKKLIELKNARTAKNKESDELGRQIHVVEDEMVLELEAQKLDMVRNGDATFSLSIVDKPTVDDWDAFYAYIHRKKRYYMLERRPLATACREIWDGPKRYSKIPGVSKFEVKSIRVSNKKG